jgi:hypothetical protein
MVVKMKAYCLAKKKKVDMEAVQVWKAKGRGHYLYLVEGKSRACPTSLWVAVGEEKAHMIAKKLKKAIKLRKKKKGKRKKSKRRRSTRKGMRRKTARRAYMGLKKKKKRKTSKKKKRKRTKSKRRRR